MSTEANQAAMRAAFSHWFGLTRKAVAVLVELYLADGEPLTARRLAELTASEECSVVRSHLFAIRQSLESGAVDYVLRRGYWLTPEGLTECRSVMHKMGGELLAA